jgi:ribonuclease J
VGLAIDTPVGLVVHSGDYKFDHTPVDGQPTDFARLALLGDRQVLALLADSTNSESPGFTSSEQTVGDAFDAVFREATGRIIVGTFASLVSRVQQVLDCAHRNGRKVAISGRTMLDNLAIARKLGYVTVPPDIIVSLEEVQRLPAHEVVILATGTQGEPSASLSRMARRKHRQISICEGDTVIMSAQTIPGNEEMVYRTINRLYQRGAHVIYDLIAPIHVSGHASQEEQKLLISLIRPKFLVPIHGELRHLHAHARLARAMGMPAENVLVVENGYILEFTSEEAFVGERVPGGYVFVDGTGVGDVGPTLLRERDQLARDGFVIIIVPLAQEYHLSAPPQIITRGFVFQPEAEDLLAEISAQAADILDEYTPIQEDDVENRLCKQIRDYIYAETRRRPVVIAVFTHNNFS